MGLSLVRTRSIGYTSTEDRDSIIYAGVSKSTARRIFQFEQYLETRNLEEGVIVECGVGYGRGLTFLMKLQNRYLDKRALWAFDTFSGFPKGHQKDSDEFRKSGKPHYKDYDLAKVKSNLISAGISDFEVARIRFIQGLIPETFVYFNQAKVALLNCDLDIYEPTKETLNFFWPKMIDGVVVMLDEYDIGTDEVKWPGAKKAVDEFCEENRIQLQRGFGNRAFLKK